MKKIFFVIALLISIASRAQIKRITGKVTSAEDGSPLSGVSISIKGTNSGSATNEKGEFSLNAAPGATLIFSYVSFENKQVEAGKSTNLSVQLTPGSNKLNNVVVIGYGTQKKKEQTAAISTISGKDIVKSPVSDATNSLVGESTRGVFPTTDRPTW